MRARLSWMITGSVVALLAAAVVMPLAVPAAAAALAANIDTSTMHGNEAEDAIAVNPTNPKNIVTMATLPDVVSGLFEGVSFDGGKTWTRRVIGANEEFADICCDQQLAWDHFGNLWMTYLDLNSGDVFVALSTDGGLTFRKVADIVPTTPPGSAAINDAQARRLNSPRAPGASADQPSISAGPGSVWVSYTSFPSVVVQAFGASVAGLGQFGTFTAPQSVPTNAGVGDYGDTAVGPGGQVLVTYQDQTGGQGGTHIYTALDPDGLGPAGFNSPLLLARSYVGGFDYIPAQPNRSVDAEANLAWDRSGGLHAGRVYAIWTAENGNETNDMDIMFQYSDDNGTNWSPAVRLNDDNTTNSQFNPAIALDQVTGYLGVSWYDARNDLGAGGRGDTDGVPNDDVQIWATDSRDGGATFAPNFQASQGTSNANDAGSFFDYGDYTHAAFQSHTFYPAWSDNSNSTGDNPDGTLHQLDLYTTPVTVR
ncbi:MAG: glycoside hydrolase [Actinomycetota bacterium]|nr:glycoside hydrolase [Actinomycetota bacterium]